jgi:hypothetical protein
MTLTSSGLESFELRFVFEITKAPEGESSSQLLYM